MRSAFSLDNWMKSGACFFAVLTLCAPQLCQGGSPAPPAAYQDLYNSLNTDLNNFNTTLNSAWNGSTYPVAFAANLANANASSGGPKLASNPDYSMQLAALKAMGVKAVVVEVGFPILYPPFYTYLSSVPGFQMANYDQFVAYYQQVAQNVRAAGLGLIVDSEVMLANDAQAAWSPAIGQYYATLDWPTFQQARAQHALTVAQTMQPDYLVVVQQPDSEATQTGQANINTVSGAASMVNQILSALQPVRSSLKVGGGVENSLVGFQGFVQSLAGVQCSVSQPCVNPPGLDYIDLRVYPINNLGGNNNFQQNVLTIAGIAASAGKPMSMTQAWLWKMRDSEYQVVPYDTIRARDPFSFWAPLDTYFIQLMENLANYTQMLFMAPEGPYYFATYLTYDSNTKNLSPGQILSQEITASNQANQVGAYTSTGVSYYNSLVQPPDTVPPSTPTITQASSGSSTTASLSWSTSTDNVGVIAYYVWRNGVLILTSALTQFKDSGLTGNTTYTYQVSAVDLAGNVSAPAVVNITTQNITPPNPPTNVAAVPVSCQEVTVTWTPTTGNVPAASYLLFQGTSPNNLVQIQKLSNTRTSFNIYHLTPGTTYYYGMEAKATNNLISPMSNIAMVTTLAPPSAPTNVAATALSSTKVSVTWSPSTGGMPIANYHVYRGTSPSNLAQVGIRTVTSYTDLSVTSGTTYYYAVQATDTGGDLSPMSATVSVTTP